jgi:hypothetical protein
MLSHANATGDTHKFVDGDAGKVGSDNAQRARLKWKKRRKRKRKEKHSEALLVPFSRPAVLQKEWMLSCC